MTRSRSITVEEFESEALPHLKHLYQTAAHAIGDRTEAEDLVQQTYLQAWKAFDRFQPGTNCRAWLFQILFNVIRHHRRGWYSRRVLVDCDFFEDVLPAENPIPDILTDEDVLSALENLGYNRALAESALRRARDGDRDAAFDVLFKRALQILTKG